MKARHGDLSDQEKNRIRKKLSTIYQEFVGKKDLENQKNPQNNQQSNAKELILDEEFQEEPNSFTNSIKTPEGSPIWNDSNGSNETNNTNHAKDGIIDSISQLNGSESDVSRIDTNPSSILPNTQQKKEQETGLGNPQVKEDAKSNDHFSERSNSSDLDNDEIEYLTNWHSDGKELGHSPNKANQDSIVSQERILMGNDTKIKDSALLTSIYDRILRVFFYYKREWLVVVENSIFYGIVTKRNTMIQLAEINDSSLPKISLSAKDIIFPTVSEALEQMRKQENFLQIDRQGEVLDTLSRPAFLALVEKIAEYQQPISLLEINDFVYESDNQQKTDRAAEPAEERVHSYNNDIDWLMSMILESLPMELVAVDIKGRILFFNDHFKDFLRKIDNDLLQSADKFEEEARKSINRIVSQKKSTNNKRATMDTKKKSFIAEFHFGSKKSKWNFSPLIHQQSLMGYALRKIP